MRAWSVLATGVARHLDGEQSERATALDLPAWSGARDDVLIGIEPVVLSGRRTHVGPARMAG